MSSYNRVILMGNLTRDPELKTLPSGAQVANFSIAINDRIKKGDNWEDYTSYFDCVAFTRNAENIERFFCKGKPILVEGKLRWMQWEDKNSGQKRSKVEVIVDTWSFCGNEGGGKRDSVENNSANNKIKDDDTPF